jgi:hypothetical protein
MIGIRTTIAIAGALCALGASTAAAVDVEPTTVVTSFRGGVSAPASGSSGLAWGGADRFAVRPALGEGPLGYLVRNRGLETSRFEGGGAVVRRTFAAAPDGYTLFDLVDPSIETLLGRARAGTIVLRPSRLGGVATLRGEVRLGPNDCAGLRGGVKTIDLDPATLLPIRVQTRRAGDRTDTFGLDYFAVDRALPARAFRPAGVGGHDVFRADQGFRRTSAQGAARNLPYVPKLPTVLPAGFALAVSGWAPRSGITGAEGSIPARPSLFAAVYARGWERIELTQRRAVGGDWPDDPFGGECRPLSARTVSVNGVPATFALGPETGPHLYWREGPVLHTLSGPFPADVLVAAAASLAPVTPTS